jgi:DNA mismatch repair protein MutL
VRDRLLLRAVLDGYESLIMRGRYPFAFLFANLPPGEIDVNVHPAKLEVRFRRPAAVHQLIVPSLRARLSTMLKSPEPGTRVTESAGADGVHEGGEAYRVAPSAREPMRADGPAQVALWQPAPRGFATLRFVGQLFQGYLLCEGDGRVVLIDQHAAHERVTFERLCADEARGEVARTPLLVPETVSLPRADAGLLAEHREALAAAGLEGEPFGDETFLVRTVPQVLVGHDVGALLRAVAAELVEEGASTAARRAQHATLATIACHSAVRVGQRLEANQVQALLEAMDRVDVNAHCPHGRPVAVELRRSQVEALFAR